MGGVCSQLKGREDDVSTMAVAFGMRTVLRPTLSLLLNPFMYTTHPDGRLEKWSPAVRFDVTQRASRATFAVFYVIKAVMAILKEYRKRRSEALKEKGEEGQQCASLLHHYNADTKAILCGFLGFAVADTMDVFTLWGKYGVRQLDIIQHHVVMIAVYLYSVLRYRMNWTGIFGILTEVLVPCGVVLWWLRAYNSNPALLKLVRVIGLTILWCWRAPLFIKTLKTMWMSRNQDSFEELLGQKKKPADAVDAPAQEPKVYPGSLLKAVLTGNLKGMRDKNLLEVLPVSLSVLFGLYLDYGWAQLYLQGLRS